jgi:hypothetical protein
VLEDYSNSMAAGNSPQTAFARAKKISAHTPELREMLSKQYNELTSKTGGNTNNLALDNFASSDEEFNVKNKVPIVKWGIPFTGDVPPIPPQAYAEFERGVEERYRYNGDIVQARQNAWNDMKKNWGVDRTSGAERTMEFPPYRVYGLPPVEGDAIIRKELNSFIEPMLKAANKTNIKPDDVILESTKDTPNTYSYKLMAPIDSEHKDLGYYPILGPNMQPLGWRMDVKGALGRHQTELAAAGQKEALANTPAEQARIIKARTRYGGS